MPASFAYEEMPFSALNWDTVVHLEHFPCLPLEKSTTMNWGKLFPAQENSQSPSLENSIPRPEKTSIHGSGKPSILGSGKHWSWPWKSLHCWLWKTLHPKLLGTLPSWLKTTLPRALENTISKNLENLFITRSGEPTALGSGESSTPKSGGLSAVSLEVSEWGAGKFNSGVLVGEGNYWLVVFADFHGNWNTTIMADFELSIWHRWKGIWEGMLQASLTITGKNRLPHPIPS